MNAASAGPLVAVVLDWREHRGNAFAGRVGRSLLLRSLVLFLVGMVLGGLMAWLAWSGPFWRELLDRLPSRIYFGAWELLFSTVLLILQGAWWRWAPGRAGSRAARGFLALLSSTNLLYHFPPLFVVAAMLSSGEFPASVPLNDATFPRLVWQDEILAMTVHFWLASFAVAGVMLAMLAGPTLSKDDPDAARRARLIVGGARLALAVTLLQIPVGMWILTVAPPLRQRQLMGGDWLGTSLLVASVLLALWLMHQLAAIALGATRRQAVLRAAALLLAVIVLMSGVVRSARPMGNDRSSATPFRPATPGVVS